MVTLLVLSFGDFPDLCRVSDGFRRALPDLLSGDWGPMPLMTRLAETVSRLKPPVRLTVLVFRGRLLVRTRATLLRIRGKVGFNTL